MGNTIILLPAYKPEEKMLDVLSALLQGRREAGDGRGMSGIGGIVVVDDGGQEPYAHLFEKARALGCIVVSHEVNRGKGAAIRTGIRAAIEHFGRDIQIVTADADGQHEPADILKVAAVLAEENRAIPPAGIAGAEGEDPAGETAAAKSRDGRRNGGKRKEGKPALVLGVRDFSGEEVPWRSRTGNRITSVFFRVSTGKACGDTQTGLRGIPAALLPLALSTEGDRYEYEMNFLTEAVKQSRLVQVPIRTVYEEGNRTSHFRPVRDSLLIYRKPIRYVAVGGASAVVDWAVFLMLLRLFGISAFSSGRAAASTGAAASAGAAAASAKTAASAGAAAASAGAAAGSAAAGIGATTAWLAATDAVVTDTAGRAGASGLSAAAARICSGLFNFECNRRWSFQSGGHAGAEAVRYLVLFAGNMVCNAGIVSSATFAGIPAAPAKFAADVVLFVVNYQVQKHWVFRKKLPGQLPETASEQEGSES